jgi:hypothetical protein
MALSSPCKYGLRFLILWDHRKNIDVSSALQPDQPRSVSGSDDDHLAFGRI